MYEIKKGVPLPQSRGSRKYPLGEMEVGDCFDVPVSVDFPYSKVRSSVGAAMRATAKATGRTFVSRHIKNGDLVRVWRLT